MLGNRHLLSVVESRRKRGRDELQATDRLQVTVPLDPQSETLVWASVPQAIGGKEQCVLVEGCQDGESGWLVARAVVQVSKGRIPLRNPHPYTKDLPARRPLAKVTSVDQGDIQAQRELVLTRTEEDEVEVSIRALTAQLDCNLLSVSLQGEGLTEQQQARLADLLRRWSGVFAEHEEDCGRTSAVLHRIPTGGAPTVRERYRPVPPGLYPELRALLQSMLDGGIVKESSSPWAAPVVLVREKDGSWRFCVDYRKLNAVTHKDSFPLPRIEETLTILKQAAWYSTLDLVSGYWQVEVDPRNKEKTAFTTPMGLFEFERMPFGLCNAPATCQRLMQRCLGGQVHDYLLIYLDDVIVYSPTFDLHLEHLEQVLKKLEEHGLKLHPQQCRLFRRSVKYLGHVVSQQGVATDPEKTEAVGEWPTPTTVREVRSFLGFVGYHRRFIAELAKVAAPLHGLLQGTGGAKTARVAWTAECEGAFQGLKQALLQAPVLAFADFSLPFRL